MVKLANATLIKIPQKKGVRFVYIAKCIDCNKNEIRCERKYLNKHSGKCRYCVHKGIPYQSAYNHLKDSVKRTNKKRKRKRVFALTFDDFLKFTQITNCFYCNDQINWVAHTGKGQHKYNLDRKDSTLGYLKENLVVCCKLCNYMKGNYYSCDEFIEIINLLDRLRNGTVIKK